MKIDKPYHEGELQVQARVGALEEGVMNSRVIQNSIIKGALRFLNQLPMMVFGSLDHDLNIWASVFMGKAGFMQAENDRTVVFDLTGMMHNPHDPFWTNIESNHKVGMLAIELASRRRLRINGTIERTSDEALTLRVEESYPNCPKYIQRRHMRAPIHDLRTGPLTSEHGTVLGAIQQTMVTNADTFFVASVHPERGVDASHRGGNPGFVKILNDRTLRIPDYPGNSMFNTLGNLTVHPLAGLVVVDFATNHTLQLTGKAEIFYDVADSGQKTGGTNRFWQLRVDHWVHTTPASPIAWEFFDYSPYNP